MNSKTLLPAHLADLQQSGLTDETIRAAGIYTVTPGDIGKKLGGNDGGIVSMLAFPYPRCEGYERFKCWYQEGKSGPKYRQKTGTPNRLYLPTTVDLTGDSPLTICEGEKKTLALNQAGIPAVGIGGVWNWCQKGEGYKRPKESRPIADLDLVNWRRPVTVIFDSDGHDNPLVRLAAFRLARELSRRGAAVSILFIPPSPTGEKQGADDYLVAYGAAKLREMLP
jgi:putative DNA primase/helicase